MTGIHVDVEEVLERVDDAFFALDDDWRFTFLNEHAAEVLDVDRERIVGEVVWGVFEPAVGTTFQREYERAMETQEPVSFEEYYPPLETWFEVNAYPSESGLSVYFRDVTDRKERERELERYEEIVEAVQDGIYVVDEEGRFDMVNEAYTELVGYDREELLGEPVTKVVDEETAADAATIESELVAGERSGASKETTIEREGGHTVDAEATFSMLPGGKRVGVVRDVTERNARERALTRVRDLLARTERIADVAGWDIDAATEEVFWTDHLFDMLGVDYEEEPSIEEALDVYVEEDRPKVEGAIEEGIANEEEFNIEARYRRPDGEVRWLQIQGVPIVDGGDVVRLRGAVQDVTGRKEFEQQLVALHDVAEDLVRAESDDEIATIATDAIHEILDAPAAWYYQYDADEDVLGPAEVSDSDDLIGVDLPSLGVGEDSLTGSVFSSGETERLDDMTASPYYHDPTGDIDLRSGILAPVNGYGVLTAGSPKTGAFDERTSELVDIVATTMSAAFSRVDREQRLRRQRDRLTALNDINSLVHSLGESVFALSDREEIERLVCERLADSDAYEFAWVGTARDGEVTVNTQSGADGDFDGVTLSLGDSSDEAGPTVRAHLTGEMQVDRSPHTDPRNEPRSDRTGGCGYDASAAIPIANEDGVRGTLNVYSGRTDAFGEEERDALRRLGSILAYALSSVERDRKLQHERNRLELMNRLLRHNLLNSLNVVRARLDLLDGRVDDAVSEHLTTAADRTEEMIQLVETIRDVTKVISRGEEQELEPTALDDVLTTRVEAVQQSYPDADYHLESPPAVDVVADDLLGEVLDNVLVNAVQHNSGESPQVWVDASVDGETVTVSVADDGPGISEERQSSLFDRESQDFVDPDSGFGLYLVREILDSYGGSITVEDNEPEGARFLLRFRRA